MIKLHNLADQKTESHAISKGQLPEVLDKLD